MQNIAETRDLFTRAGERTALYSKEKQLGKKKKQTLSKVKKDCWKWCSLYVRVRDCIETCNSIEEGECFTCGKVYPIKKLQAGHFIPGRNNRVLFDVDQIHIQCYHCNIGLKGHWVEYLKRMRLLWGERAVNKMLKEHNRVVKYSVEDLERLRDTFKHDYEELIRCFNKDK